MEHNVEKYIELYNSGMSCSRIAKMLNVSVYIVSSRLKKHGIKVVNKQNELPCNLDQIIKDYKTGDYSASQLSKKYNLSVATICKWLKKYECDVINKQNEVKFNQHVFDKIDTEDKAYWLGFIFADGYISSSDYSFELSLSIEDVDHLHKFNKFMEHKKDNVKIGSVMSNGKMFKRCRWGVCNKHLWNTLNSIGCYPKKSLILKFPDISIFTDKSLIRHFIRGYFDGDGTIGISNTIPFMSLLGTESFLRDTDDYILGDSKIHITKNRAFAIQRASTYAVFIAYCLYYKSNIYLDRKYNKFLLIKDCRFKAKALKLLEGKIGEGWDANPELIADLKDLQQCNA